MEPAPIHVVHVTLSLDHGGLERVVLHLAQQAPSLHQRVSLLCLEKPGALASEAEKLGVTVHCVHKQPGLRFDTVGKVREVLRQLQPDVVHTHQIGALFYTGPAAHSLKVPVILHTEHGKQIRTRKQKLMAWWAARYAQVYYCVSADILETLAGRIVFRHKLRVMPNGIDVASLQQSVDTAAVRREWNIPDGAPVIGTVGRLAKVKRQDLLLDVFALVRKQMPTCHLLLVGDGEERANLEAHAQKLGVTDAVRFVGFQSDPAPFLHLMSVFLLTSESEGMPLSLLEAWAVGAPVAVFAVGGLPELIKQGETGYLSNFGDVTHLAQQVIQLLQHPDQAQKLAKHCQHLAETKYDVTAMATGYDRAYREMLQSRGASAPGEGRR